MNETLEQFTERMSTVEKKEEFCVGRASSGHSRAIFDFEGQCCWLESLGYRIIPRNIRNPTPAMYHWMASSEPSDYWMHSLLHYEKKHAEEIMKYYGGRSVEEDYYPPEGQDGKWFSITFDEFEDLMKMVYAIHTGEHEKMFGKEPWDMRNVD